MTLKKSLCLVLTLLISIVFAVACTPTTPQNPTPQVTLTKIEIDPYSIDASYYVGDIVDLSTISVTATYSDGSEEILSYDDITVISMPNTQESGETSLIVTYKDKSATLPVNVNDVSVSRIEAIGFKSSYVWGETIDLETVKIRMIYNNGAKVDIPLSEAKANGANVTLPNTKVLTEGSEEGAYITISYLGKLFTQSVDIINPIVKIELDSQWRTFVFRYNASEKNIKDALSNITVNAIHANGKIAKKNFTELEINYSEIDVTEPTDEPKSFTVKYSVFTTTATYTVAQAPTYTGIGFGTGHSFKNSYYPGEALDTLDKIKVQVIKDDNTTIDGISVGENLTVSGYDEINTSVPGIYTLTLVYTDAYGESISFADKIIVSSVKEVQIGGFDKNLAIGDKFDNTFASFEIVVIYDDGSRIEFLYKDVESTNGILADEIKIESNVDTSKAGDNYMVVIEYLGITNYVVVCVNTADVPATDSGSNVTDKVGL